MPVPCRHELEPRRNLTASVDPARMSRAIAEGAAVHLSYDAAVDVAYLSFRPLRPGEQLGPNLLMETDRDFPGTIMLDFSAEDGEVVGLEFGMASRCLPALLLATAERTDGTNVTCRFEERVAGRLAADGRPAKWRARMS